MNCPKCNGVLSAIESSERVSVDFCQGCKGIWFEAGEVAAYFDLSTDLPDLQIASATRRPTAFQCPRCRAALEEVQFSRHDALRVDTCATCRGVWLDGGEVPRVERLAAQVEKPGSRMLRSLRDLRQRGYVVLGVDVK